MATALVWTQASHTTYKAHAGELLVAWVTFIKRHSRNSRKFDAQGYEIRIMIDMLEYPFEKEYLTLEQAKQAVEDLWSSIKR